MEQRDQRVNQAQASGLSRERQQEADSLRTVRQAQAAASEQVRTAQAKHDAFLARYQARSALSVDQEIELILDSLGTGRSTEDAVNDYRKRRAEAIARQQAVNDFRLLWDMLGQTLSGRDKVVIDTEKVPGRRNLWFLPLDLLRQPALLAPERSTRRPPRGEAEEP
jgi:hypothetical protein